MLILSFLQDEVFLRGFLILLVLSFLTAPVGCFVVWRKMSYFGATLAHSTLLGAVLGILLGVGMMVGVIGFTVILAITLGLLIRERYLSADALLGMMAHFILAVGLIAVSVMDDLRIDLMAYLFGSVFAVDKSIFYAMIIVTLIAVFVLIFYWKAFLNLTVCQEIAQAERLISGKTELIFVICLAATVSLGMQAVGALLIIALLIIPAITARLFAKSMLSMVVYSWLITITSIVCGMILSLYLDLPAEASIVVFSGLLFFVLFELSKRLLK